jgi:dodecin
VRVAVLNTIELEGVSTQSWRDAAEEALREAAKTLRNIRRMDVLGTSASVADDGTITEYRAQVRLVFEVESSR